MATILVGGLRAWRDTGNVSIFVQDIKHRFMSAYKREQNK
jgi:hypothetical protein